MGKRLAASAIMTLNVCAAVLVGYLALRPAGPLRTQIESWKARRADARLLAKEWPQIVGSAPRTIDSTRPPTLVEFIDYECPVCRAQHQALAGRGAYFAIRQFPLALHPHARLAASAAICAAKQHHFPQMHRELLESSQWLVDSNMVAIAAKAGVPDTISFRVCLTDQTTNSAVEADLELGRHLQVTGTPTFFDAERRFTGMLPESVLGAQGRRNAAPEFRGPAAAETVDTLM